MKKEYIYFRESLLQSVLSDIFTFSMLFLFLFVNHIYLGDHWYIAISMLIIWLLMSYSRAMNISKIFTNIKSFKEYIDKELQEQLKSL